MATTPYTGFTSSNLPATVTTTPATFQTPSVVSPSPINTNATFDQIAAVTQPVPSFTSQSPVINPAITTGIVNRTNEQIVADQQAALANSVEQQNQNSLSGEIQKYLGLSGTPGFNEQKAAEQATLMQSNDVTGKAAAVKGIIDKINANKVLAQIGGTATNVGGLTQGQYTADIESKNLLLGAQLLVAQGQYDSARDAVTQAIDMKYAPQEARYNALLKYYDVNAKALGDKGAQMKELTTAKLADIAEKKAADKAIEDLLVTASQVAPADVMARAKLVRERGGGAAEVAAALGQYGGDYLKNLKLKEEINKLKADTAKTRSEIVKIDNQASLLKAQPTGVVTAPNGDAIGIPSETIAAIGKLKLNEGQANAVAFTSRMIQAAQALDSQLGGVSPTGGFYETTGYDPTSAGSSIGRLVGSDQSRVYNTNAQDFIRAKLRKESGAAIGKDEFDADAAIYTPSGAGLDEKDLLLAKIKRDEAIKSMIAQAGPAAPYLQQYYEEAKTQGGTFVSENPQLNSWYKNTSAAVETSTTQAANAGGTYGFSDNQK